MPYFADEVGLCILKTTTVPNELQDDFKPTGDNFDSFFDSLSLDEPEDTREASEWLQMPSEHGLMKVGNPPQEIHLVANCVRNVLQHYPGIIKLYIHTLESASKIAIFVTMHDTLIAITGVGSSIVVSH